MLDKLKMVAIKTLNNPLKFWLIVILVYILSRVATWGYPFDSDHWIFYYVGKIWAEGGNLYIDAWDHKPPLIFLFNGFMHLIFGGSVILHRIWLTILSFVDIFLFYKILKIVIPKLLNKVKSLDKSELAIKVGLILYVFLRNLSQFTSSGNNTENYGLIFLLLMWLSHLSFRKDGKWWKMLLSGLFCSVLFFLKGNFILLGLPIGFILLLDNLKAIKKFFGYGLIFAAPIIAHAGVWFYYFYSKGSLEDFLIATFKFSAKYSGSAWSGNLSNNIMLLLVTLVLIAPALIFFIFYLKDLKDNFKNKEYIFVGLSFLAGLGLTFGVGSFYSYYFEIIMPVIVLVIVYVLFNLSKFKKIWQILLVILLATSLLFSYGISLKQLYNSLSGPVRIDAEQYQEVANYVKDNSSINDKVFCYDYGAVFYRLSDRDSGSRFISASVLLLEYRDNYGFNFNKIFMQDMEKNKTKYIVTYSDRESLYYENKPLVDYFDKNYELDKKFDTFEVLKKKD